MTESQLFHRVGKRQSESQVERWLGKRLRDLGCLYCKFVSPGNDGMPDRLIIMPGGRILFLELKTTTGRLCARQRYQIGRLLRWGCTARVAYGRGGAEQFLDYLLELSCLDGFTEVPK